LQCDVCLAARVDKLAAERRVAIPTKVLGLIHRDLSRTADSPGARPVQRNDSRLLRSFAKTVDDRLRPHAIECELRFESQFLLLRGQMDLYPRHIETSIPEARLEFGDGHRLLLHAHRKSWLLQRDVC